MELTSRKPTVSASYLIDRYTVFQKLTTPNFLKHPFNEKSCIQYIQYSTAVTGFLAEKAFLALSFKSSGQP